MIYYFTGTGNSLYVARRLAELTGAGIVSIAEIMKGKPMPEAGETAGIVYPIYAWSPPEMVLDFVRKRPIKSGYIFSVCTCGDDTGHAMKRLTKAMGRALDSAFSIAMPNNYIAGFDVDTEGVAEQKLTDAEARIVAIANAVNNKKKGIYDVHEGSMPGLKSALISPLFNAFGASARPFYAEDSCSGCKRCEAVCPMQNICVKDKPQWGSACTCCLACLHHCPVRAIQRGKGTKQKGRYVNPNCRVEYDFTQG